jgi:uncharacterized lipoprotein YajG
MKKLLTLIAIVLLASCSTQKTGIQTSQELQKQKEWKSEKDWKIKGYPEKKKK